MKIFRFIFIIIIILSANLSYSQRDGDRKKFRDGIDTIMKQKLIDRLGVDESSADKFLNVYKDHNKQVRIIHKEKKDLMETIELDPGASDMDSKLDKMLELETKIVDAKKSFFNELRTFLSPQQIARTLILRKNFEKEFRKQINKQREGRKR